VIKREGQDDYWLNIGLVFPHKDTVATIEDALAVIRQGVARACPDL
jgi:hypothetical protein